MSSGPAGGVQTAKEAPIVPSLPTPQQSFLADGPASPPLLITASPRSPSLPQGLDSMELFDVGGGSLVLFSSSSAPLPRSAGPRLLWRRNCLSKPKPLESLMEEQQQEGGGKGSKHSLLQNGSR